MPSFVTDADRRLGHWHASAGARTAIVVVFLGSAVMQITGVPFTPSFDNRSLIDLDVYRIGAQIWQQGQGLYADGSMPFTSDGVWLPFTYPPFAALTFVPLGAMPLLVAGVLMSVVSIALTVLVVHLFLRLLAVGADHNRWWLSLTVGSAVLWLNPYWMTLGFGQINIILMAMVAADVFVIGQGRAARLEPARGVLVGLASAIKLTPLVFIVLFAAQRRWRAAATSCVTFVGAAVLGWIWLPTDTYAYWTHTLFHTGRIGDPAGRINQNLNAFWIRLLPGSPTAQTVAWVVSALAVTALAAAALFACRPRTASGPLRRSGRVDAMLATCVVAVWGLLVSPTSWAHHWVWSVPVILAATVVVARSPSRAVRIAYGLLAVAGVVIFTAGPYQFLPLSGTWEPIDHILGNLYSAWGVCALLLIWLLPPRRTRVVADESPAIVDAVPAARGVTHA